MRSRTKGERFSTRLFLIGGAFWISSTLVRAGNGETAFEFLNEPPGARSASMGNTSSSSADDVDMSLWNPAALSELRQPQLSLGMASHVGGNRSALSYGRNAGAGAVGFSLRVFDSGDIPRYSSADARDGTYSVKQSLAAIGYAMPWRDCKWGMNIKQAREDLAGQEARAWAFDGGLLYRRSGWPVTLALALRNFGGRPSYGGESFPLPASWDAGANLHLLGESVLISLESRQYESGESQSALGAEAWFRKTLAFRAGWQSGRWLGNGLSLGVGLKIRELSLDYSFTPQGEEFAPSHRVGVSWRFGRPGEALFLEGLRLAEDGRHAEAILKFQQALDAQPENDAAVRALRDSVHRLKLEMREDPPTEEHR